MADMAKHGAHSARHRAGRSLPDADRGDGPGADDLWPDEISADARTPDPADTDPHGAYPEGIDAAAGIGPQASTVRRELAESNAFPDHGQALQTRSLNGQ